ncbi:MAG: EF-P lysine aminoacylase GenX [Alcanivoracaceae bacterium]|nr:EF-P lysine aminoacylase GenX [Alcanivoracaceae bacterium]
MQTAWKSQSPLQVLKQRAFLLSKIREFFTDKGVLEVETPILSSAGNTDVNIESFTTEKISHDNLMSYLRTSPEFPLKRLICSGIGDVFEIGKVFRRGEISKTHNVEFTMLEWYRLSFSYFDLIEEVKELFENLLFLFNKPVITTELITFNECFNHYLAINPQEASINDLNKLCNSCAYDGSQLSRNEALDFLFATQIQPRFNKEALSFVTHYPATQAALAQINPEDRNTSLRFEVFYQGCELGNGYQELTDSEELLRRFGEDNQIRNNNNNSEIQIDHKLITAMRKGMPACSGVAVGIDRLLMVLLGCESISEVITFTAENA